MRSETVFLEDLSGFIGLKKLKKSLCLRAVLSSLQNTYG